MRIVLFEPKNIRLHNKKYFVENKTEIMLHVYKYSEFACSLYIQNKILGVFSYVQANK
jgi:hypothetical protein